MTPRVLLLPGVVQTGGLRPPGQRILGSLSVLSAADNLHVGHGSAARHLTPSGRPVHESVASTNTTRCRVTPRLG